MERARSHLLDIVILLWGMYLCGSLSMIYGRELHWDLAGYHFYNPYAYLYNRINIDYWPPSAIQNYITPTLDFLSYYLIKHFHPAIVEFVLGAIHGINFGLIFFIARFFMRQFDLSNNLQWYLALAAACLGMYGPTVYPLIGSFSNDNTVSIFILAAILSLLFILEKYFASAHIKSWQLVGIGLLFGIALGCKLTTAIYAIGALLSLSIIPMPATTKLKMYAYLIFGMFAGLLLSSGYWMLLMWQHYQNPFFPFLNGIFHSNYYLGGTFIEYRYVPKYLSHVLFFPFYFAYSLPTSEMPFTDFRFAILYLLLIFYLFLVSWRQIKNNQNIIFNWFVLFFISTFIVWESFFSIMRYLSVLQMLTPVLILLIVLKLLKTKILRFSLIGSLFLFIMMTMRPMGTERAYLSKDFFNVVIPKQVLQVPEASVLIAYIAFAKNPSPRPNNYFIPFFPEKWRFFGLPYGQHTFEMTPEILKRLENGPKNIYLLASSEFIDEMYRVMAHYHFKASGPCQRLMSDRARLTLEVIELCPITRHN